MTRQIVLMRGINLGPNRRIGMPALRELLGGRAGLHDVRTYVQSGNVVLSSELGADELAGLCEREIAAHFGFEVRVVVRSRDELAEVVRRNPLQGVAVDPKRYQVTFLAAELGPEALSRLDDLEVAPEQVVVVGREVYSWHPAGVGRSRLWARLAGEGWLGVTATARNWTTVSTLLTLADKG